MSASTLAEFLSAFYTSPLSVRETIATVSFREKHLPEILHDYERLSSQFRSLHTFSVKLNGMCAELNSLLAAAGGQCTLVPRVTSFQPRQHRLPAPATDDTDIVCTNEPSLKASTRKTVKTPAKVKSDVGDFNDALVGSLLRLNFAEKLASDINRAHQLFEEERENEPTTQLVIDQATDEELPFPELDLCTTADPRIQKMIDIVDSDEAIWDSLFSVLPVATVSTTKGTGDPCKTPKPAVPQVPALPASSAGASHVRALNFEEQQPSAPPAAVVEDDVELVAEVRGDDPLVRFAERCAKKERRSRQPLPTILRHRTSPAISPSSTETPRTPASGGRNRKRKIDPMLSPQSDAKRTSESLQALASLAAAELVDSATSALTSSSRANSGGVENGARIEGLIRIEEEGAVENAGEAHENFEGLMALFTLMTQQQRPEPVPPPPQQQLPLTGSAQRRLDLTPSKIDAVLRKLHRL